ncbi:uncharacterized protein [Asterias amurensis]|uniref:uncharacterized protein n=1 Tax=Asterias amurensis TaxID=7602 RepID=UPI003AB5D971
MDYKICLDKRTYDFKEGVCIYCNKGDDDVDCGKLLKDPDDKISVHNYCLLFASGLSQRGEDSEGINGFLLPDILSEFRRAKRLKCGYCSQPRATVGCSVQNCRRGYHFNCGFKKEAIFLFFDTFLSYCVDHRPQQVAPTNPCSQSSVTCPICMDEVEAKVSNHTLKTPCCNNTWFHRTCVQRQALSAGYFFRCAICNNQTEFQDEMKRFGIYIPEHDASWEQEDNAYQELYWRHDNCDIDPCKCPKGRKYNEVSSKWELVLCDLCGSCGCHLACGGLKNINQDWACSQCNAMLSNATEVNCPSKKSSQVPTSPCVDSPTKIGNSTRTAMKLMGKHPRTPLSAHGMRKKSATTTSSQFGSLDHCRPSTSKEGLQETTSPSKRKRKLSFNSKENALGDTNNNSQDTNSKKHCPRKTQSLEFWCENIKSGLKASAGLCYGKRTTLRMSMRPRNVSQPSKIRPVPSKCKTAESPAKKAMKKAINTSGSKTKGSSTLVASKIEAYFSAASKEFTGKPVNSVKKDKGIAVQGSSKPISLNKTKMKSEKVREVQVQDKSKVAKAASSKQRGKGSQRKPTLIKIKITKRQPDVGSPLKGTSEKRHAGSGKSFPKCDRKTSVIKKEYEDKSAETPSTERSASPTEQEVFFKNMKGRPRNSVSFMLNWGKKGGDNDDVSATSTCEESTYTSGESDCYKHEEENTVRGRCNTTHHDSFQGPAPPDGSTPAGAVDKGEEEIQLLSRKSGIHQDISLQNESTGDATPFCNLREGKQLSACKPIESSTSQVLSKDSPAGKANSNESTPGISNPQSAPRKRRKMKLCVMYPSIKPFRWGTKVKRRQKRADTLLQRSQRQKCNYSQPTPLDGSTPAVDVDKVEEEIQLLYGKSGIHQDISLQNESTGDATLFCNLWEGEQSSASQPKESSTSQVLSKDSPAGKANSNESTPGSGNPQSAPRKRSRIKLRHMYPLVKPYLADTKVKQRQKRAQSLLRRSQRQKGNDSQSKKKAARSVPAVIKPVNQVRETSSGMLLRRLHSKRNYSPYQTRPGEKPSVSSSPVKSTRPPVKVEEGTKKASSIEVDLGGGNKEQLSWMPRRETIDYSKLESYLATDISPTLHLENSEETLSHPDIVQQTGGASLRMREGKKKQDICDESFEIASQSDGVPSPVPSALISEDANEIFEKSDATSCEESTHTDAESLEESTVSSEHWTPSSKHPNQDPIIPSVITDDKTTDESVCEKPGDKDKNALGLEILRPPSADPKLSSETSPDSGISQSYSCNIDELTVEKPSSMIEENSFPPWLPRESPTSALCKSREQNDMVDDQSQNGVEDELVEKNHGEHGEAVPPSCSKSDIGTNDTSRSPEKRNGNCPKTESGDLKTVTWDSYRNIFSGAESDIGTNKTSGSSENRNGICPETGSSDLKIVTCNSYRSSLNDAKVSPSGSPSSKNFDCKLQNSPSISFPAKPSSLSQDDGDKQDSPGNPYFSIQCPEKCIDRDEDANTKKSISTPEKLLIQKSLLNVYSETHKVSIKQEETSKESPATSCLPSEEKDSKGSLEKIPSANSSEIKSSQCTTPEKHESVFDSPIAHNSKCPFCAGCKSKLGHDSPSTCTSTESSTDAASRSTMLLRSNSLSCKSPFSPSPTFGKVSPLHPRLYRALLGPGSRQPTRSSPRTTSPVSLQKRARDNRSPLLNSYPSRINKNVAQSCQTSSHCTPGSWPKKQRSTSRNDPRSSTGPPKPFSVTTQDSGKTKGRVKLFI